MLRDILKFTEDDAHQMAEGWQDARDLKEVPASEILEKIEKGEPVKYDHIRIIGDLDITKQNLPLKEGKFLIIPIMEIVSSSFEGTVNFSWSNLQNHVNLSKTKFTGSAIFCNSIFSAGVNFIGSQFGSSAHFYGSKFEGVVCFMDAQFSGLATFYDSMFKEDALFLKSRFKEDATFKESGFLKIAEFSSSKFSEKAIFDGTKFRGDAKFVVTRFGGFTNFRSCSFGKSLNLEGSNIYTIFLQDAIFEKDTAMLLKYAEFSRLEIPWNLIRNKLQYDGSAYLALVKNYNNLEWFDDADECNYQYRTIRRKKQLHGLKWVIDLIPWLFYGYGVRFYYPLIWLLGALIICAIIYVLGDQAQFSDAFGLSTVILTTTTQINGLNGPLTGTYWIVSIIERISGWLLMSAFLVALAKKTLR